MNTSMFDSGLPVGEYVANLRNYRSFVRNLMQEATADPEHVSALREAVSRLAGPVSATIMTEDWCGDCACNIPVLSALFSDAGIEIRVFRGSENPDLKDYIEHDVSRHQPTDHIPVISIWDGDFNEIARWIEAPAGIAEKKNAWKAVRPEFMQLYERRKTDPDAKKRFATLYHQLMGEMVCWYRDGMWTETTREIVEAVQKARD